MNGRAETPRSNMVTAEPIAKYVERISNMKFTTSLFSQFIQVVRWRKGWGHLSAERFLPGYLVLEISTISPKAAMGLDLNESAGVLVPGPG